MKTLTAVLFFLLLCTSIQSYGEVQKTGIPCEEGVCFYWWPRLPSVEGWRQDPETSNAYRVNAQVPDGSTFANAETVIYGRVLYKPETPEAPSMEKLMRDDKNQFLSRDPNISVVEVDPLRTEEGKVFRSFTFFPRGKGNWEQVSYGEETDYYLVFTVSSRTKEGFLKSRDDYRRFIERYKEKS
jgi:hypothetical protein